MAYDAGEAFLSIVPSFRGVATRIDREAALWGRSAGRIFGENFGNSARRVLGGMPLGPGVGDSTRQGAQAGGAFAAGFRARVDAALRALPDIELHADSTAAEARIATLRAKLQELSDARIGIDITAEEAILRIDDIKRQLDELNRDSPDIQVRADTAQAAARLAEIQAEIRRLNGEDPDVDVHVDDHGSAARVRGEVSGLVAILAAVAPAAIAAGAVLAAGLAGALATAGALVLAVAAIGLGLSGTGDTVKLLDQRDAARKAKPTGGGGGSPGQDNSAQQVKAAEQGVADARRQGARTAQDAARKVADAQRNLADVERRVARDRIRAAQDVADAQRDLADATSKVLDAERELADARRQAQRDLEDSANAAADAALAQRDALASLSAAQTNFDLISRSEARTDADKQAAALELAKAQQGLVEANQKLARTTVDNNAAQKAGVDGSARVVNASQAVQRARRDEGDAATRLMRTQQAQTEQQQQGSRDVVDAQRDVAEAVRDQTRSQQDSARNIARAQQQVAAAMSRAGAASAAAGAAGAAGMQEIDDKLAKVNPATLKFAEFLRSKMRPAMQGIKDAAAGGLLPGVQSGLTSLLPLFPTFEKIIGNVARAVGGLAAQAGAALNSPFWRNFFDYLARTAGPIITTFGRILGNLAKGFAGALMAFQPLADSLGAYLLRLSQRFADFGATLGQNEGFAKFTAYVQQVAPQLAQTLGQVFTAIEHIITSLAPLGPVSIGALGLLARLISAIPVGVIQAAVPAFLALYGAVKVFGAVQAIIIGVTRAMQLASLGWVAALGPIAAVAAGVGILATTLFLTRQNTRDNTAATNDYTQALNDSDGALTNSIRTKIAARLADEGIIAAGRQLGLSERDLIDATLGRAAALDRVAAASKTAIADVKANSDGHGKLSTELRKNVATVQKLNTGLRDEADAFAKARQKTDAQRGAIDSATDAQTRAADATRKLDQALKDLGSTQLAQSGAEDAFRLGLLRVNEQITQNGRSLSQATQGGLANREMLRGLLGQALSTAEAQRKNGVAIDDVTRILAGNVRQLEATATKAGLSREQVRALVAQMGLTPRDIYTKFNADTLAATHSADTLQARIDAIRQNKVPGLKANTKAARDEIAKLQREIDRIKGTHVVITRSTDGKAVSRQVGGGSRAEADGGVLSFYRRGGLRENHVAQIAPAGAWRVWAEPETGGEAYIPLAASKRTRSQDIARETVARLGGIALFGDPLAGVSARLASALASVLGTGSTTTSAVPAATSASFRRGGLLANRMKLGLFDQGGLLPVGASHVYNATGRPELIAPQRTFEQIIERSREGRGAPDSLFGPVSVTQQPFEDWAMFADRTASHLMFQIKSSGG